MTFEIWLGIPSTITLYCTPPLSNSQSELSEADISAELSNCSLFLKKMYLVSQLYHPVPHAHIAELLDLRSVAVPRKGWDSANWLLFLLHIMEQRKNGALCLCENSEIHCPPCL